MGEIARLYATIGADTSGLKKGLDQAQGGLAGLNAHLKNNQEQFRKNFGEIEKYALGIGGAVAGALIKATKDTLDYTKSMRDMSTALGVSTEEASRITQAFDDYGISVDTVRGALQMAAKNGFAPTVESISALIDKTNAIADPTERAAALTKIFGRNWAELIPAFKDGGAAFADAAAKTKDGLVVTQQQADEARKLEIAMDDVTDSMKSFSMSLGKTVIPIARDFFNTLNTGLDTLDLLIHWQDKLDAAFVGNTANVIKSDKSYKEYADTVVATGLAANQFSEITDTATIELLKHDGSLTKVNTGYGLLYRKIGDHIVLINDASKSTGVYTEAEYNAMRGAYGLNGSLDETNRALARVKPVAESAAAAADILKAAEDAANTSITLLSANMAGAVGNEMADFEKKQKDLGDQADALAVVIKTSYGQAKIDATASLAAINSELSANITAHDKATKRILMDIAMQQAAAIKDPAVRAQAMNALALQWGLVDKATATATANIIKATQGLANDGNIGNYQSRIAGMEAGVSGRLDALNEHFQRIMDYHARLAELAKQQIDFNVLLHWHEENIPAAPGRTTPLPGGAAGGLSNFIVPPGFPNDSYPLHVQSGEIVNVTPAHTAGKGAGGNTYNYNLYYYGQAPGNIQSDFGMLRALAGAL